ncbi:MAG: energy transducer TonB [Halieaceae bacterium]|jgi:periplasmic protein TonB|nr:energy transducer TonB [Halieaceae bacterium]
MYYPAISRDQHDTLGFALFMAAIFHFTLILGLTFDATQSTNQSRQIEVTLATRPTAAAPDEARYIAQANQVGSVEDASLSNPDIAPPASADASHGAPRMEPDSNPTTDPIITTAAKAIREQVITRQHGGAVERDKLAQQVAELEASLDYPIPGSTSNPRVRRLSSASAKRAVDAAYLHDWRTRLEAVGNMYYPEASRRYGIFGSLRLLVVIRKDGSLEQIQVQSSSGHAVLDEAAIKIVRLAAPFAAFPPELRASTDKLEIIRTWHFQQNQLSSD